MTSIAHPRSHYPAVVEFAAKNPLPRGAEDLGNGLLDIAALLVACKPREAEQWDELALSILYRSEGSRHPGAFLSNPALLATSKNAGKHGVGMSSYGAGCFFDYSLYQEDSLGTAILCSAFSPRTHSAKRPASLYAQALLGLASNGLIHGASAHWAGASGVAALESLAQSVTSVPSCSFSMVLRRPQLNLLLELRTSLAARAVELALSDAKPGLFGDAVRARLRAMCETRFLSEHVVASARDEARRMPRI